MLGCSLLWKRSSWLWGTFHVIFVTFFAALIAIRLRFHFNARTWSRKGRTNEGVSLFLRFFVGISTEQA